MMSTVSTSPLSNTLDQFLDAVDHLPPVPTLMIKLTELYRQPERDMDEIVSVMRKDPAITAEILRRCNGSFFSDESPVDNIYEAIFRLGFYEVYRITVALFGIQSMAAAKNADRNRMEQLWRHSATTAIMAGGIARECEESEGTAFTAGILHDLGKVVLISQEPDKYARLLEECSGNDSSAILAETEFFGFNHADIGARLLIRWDVPAEVVVPVQFHHAMAWPETDARMCAITCLANVMAHGVELQNGKILDQATAAMNVLGMNLKQAEALLPVLEQEMQKMQMLFTP